MQTLFNRHTCVAFIAASAIIGLTGLMLERSLDSSYESALPKGTVEICELTEQIRTSGTAIEGGTI